VSARDSLPESPQDDTPAEESNLAAALAYASEGRPVFPLHTPIGAGCSCGNPKCEHPGKHPRTLHGFRDASRDEKTIRQWWTQWPDANIGVVTGADSGIVVLDVDPRHSGDETLADLERQHGQLPRTVETITGGGGRHIYFPHPGGHVKSRNLAPGIDVKADGGYIVAPPSLHVSGRRYEWEVSSHPDDTPLAPLPDWLLAAIASPPVEPMPSTVDKAAAIPESKRNVTLTRLAGAMRRAGMEQSEIRAALLEINRGRCDPRLPVQEVAEIARSVSRYAPAAVPLLGVGSSLSSSLKASDGDDDANRAPVELCTLARPGPRQWVVPGLVPANALTILYGDGGMAKSLKAMLIGDCVARGQALFRRPVQQGHVLYLDWELDQDEQTRRAYRVAAGLGYPQPPPGLFYQQMVAPLGDALPQIRSWVEELQILLVIMDSFGLATLGDPTAARDVAPLLASVSRLPCTSFFIDHVRNLQPGEKPEDLRPFGSVYKFNVARSVIRATRVGGDEVSLSVLLRQTKPNFGALSEPLGLRVTFEEERVSFEQVPLSSTAFADALAQHSALDKVHRDLAAAGKASLQELVTATGLAYGTVKNKLTELHQQGRAVPLGRGMWRWVPPSSLSLPLSDDDDDGSAMGPDRVSEEGTDG
jgi:hypothetical protein